MDFDIRELIKSRMDYLRKSEKKIAEYVLDHLPDTAKLTISQLAKVCQVSDATVNRFVKGIGLGSYGNFRITAAKSRIYNVPSDIRLDDSPEQIAAKLLAAMSHAVQVTKNNISETEMTRAAELINNANRIRICSLGGSLSIAVAMNCLFAKAGYNVTAEPDLYMDYTYISQMGTNDVIVIISMSGTSAPLCKLTAIARQRRIPIIAITNSKNNPIAKIADVMLRSYTTEEAFYGDLINGKFSQYFLVGTLYIAAILKKYREVQKSLDETGEAVKFYLTPNNY
ncbi:MAG: MurR/RpiR family transcriptional regulator [Oscillospiraceae bacterium]|nr:MurR/RpiR family transcriptional regulator [Oscillospiraceae bacterium]